MVKGQVSIGREKAIELSKTGFWKDMTDRQIAEFQMSTAELCMPFGVFHKAMEATIGRPIFTHEFGLAPERLLAEVRGEAGSPSLEEILSLIPEEKRIIVCA